MSQPFSVGTILTSNRRTSFTQSSYKITFYINFTDNPLPAGAGSLGAEADEAAGRKADMTSMGSGKMTVVLFSEEMLLRVCRYRSWGKMSWL